MFLFQVVGELGYGGIISTLRCKEKPLKPATRHVWAHLTPITLRTRLCRTDCTKNGEQSVKHCHYVQFSNEPMEVRSSFRTEQKAMILLVAHKSHPRILSASEFSCNYTSIYTVIHDHHYWIIPI